MLVEWQRIWPHLAYGIVVCGLAGMLGILRQRLGAVRAERNRERRGREEMEAYARLNLRIAANGEVKDLGGRITGVIAARSPFGRVALLVRDAEDSLYLAASEGMDGAVIAGVERWLRGVAKQERATGSRWNGGVRVGGGSQVVHLDKEAGRGILVPVTVAGERFAAALLVCADSVLQIPRRQAEEAVVGLEVLAARLGQAMEEAEQRPRPRRVERLAGKLTSLRSSSRRTGSEERERLPWSEAEYASGGSRPAVARQYTSGF